MLSIVILQDIVLMIKIKFNFNSNILLQIGAYESLHPQLIENVEDQEIL